MKKLTNKETRKIRKAGRKAYLNGLFTDSCPYNILDDTDEKAEVWLDGFDDAVGEDLMAEEDYLFGKDY